MVDVLFPHLASLAVQGAERRDGTVVLTARSKAAAVSCGSCGVASGRVHARYVRRLADLSVCGASLVIELSVRRFRCLNPVCPARTFAEQIAGVTQPYGRRTLLLQRALTSIALAVAGRAGARLAGRLGIGAGRDTLLRLIRALPDEAAGPVRVLGVDDFAVRRGTGTAPSWLISKPADRPASSATGTAMRLPPGFAPGSARRSSAGTGRAATPTLGNCIRRVRSCRSPGQSVVLAARVMPAV